MIAFRLRRCLGVRMGRMTLPLVAAMISLAPLGVSAADTEVKVRCTCKDNVGTWTQSCYSVNTCSACCGYSGATAVLRAPKERLREVTESPVRGKMAPAAPAKAAPAMPVKAAPARP